MPEDNQDQKPPTPEPTESKKDIRFGLFYDPENKFYASNQRANGARAEGNVGDSFESRLGNSFLGGGSDTYNGLQGYHGEMLQQSMFGGEESTLRGAHYSSPLNKVLYGGASETRAAWNQIKICNSVYENDGQVASIIDLMADFTTEGVKFTHGKDSVHKFYDAWAMKVKLRKTFRKVVIQLLNTGVCFLYRVYAKLDAKEERAMKTFTVGQRVGEKFIISSEDGSDTIVDPKITYDSSLRCIVEANLDDKKIANSENIQEEIKKFVIAKLQSDSAKIIEKDIKPGASKVVPWKYITLNPTRMMPDEDGGWVYLLTKEDVQKLLKKANVSFNEEQGSIHVKMPDGVNGNLKKTDVANFFAEMKIQSERLIPLHYNKSDWKNWGTGLTWKAMSTVSLKNTLRAMEIKTAKAGINTAMVWKLGDHKEGYMPGPEDFERLADILKAPSSNLHVLWNSAIDVDVVQPKIKEIFDTKRWEEIRKSITAEFGITQSVVTGEGGNFSSSFISVQGLLEKLQSIRDLLMEDWIMEEIVLIHKAMGFRNLPRVAFGQMSLRDAAAEKTFILNLYDRGIVSDKTLYETLDKDADIERERLLNELQWEDEHNFDRRGPYIKDPQQHVLDERRMDLDEKNSEEERELRRDEMDHSKEMDKKKLTEDTKIKKQQLKQKQTQKGPNGRPPGTKKKQEKKRESKPKNLANRKDVEVLVTELDKNAKGFLVTRAGVADYRSLSKDDKNEVLSLVAYALGELDEKGSNTLVAPAFMNKASGATSSNFKFFDSFEEKSRAFIKDVGRRPKKAEVYQILIDAYMET